MSPVAPSSTYLHAVERSAAHGEIALDSWLLVVDAHILETFALEGQNSQSRHLLRGMRGALDGPDRKGRYELQIHAARSSHPTIAVPVSPDQRAEADAFAQLVTSAGRV
jgi:hypothetical protein